MGAQFQVDEVSLGQSSDISILWYLDFCGELGTGSKAYGLTQESMKLHLDQPTLIGRGVGDEGFLILNARISRRHASLSIEPAGIRVKDLGSTNGTFVNGLQVQETIISVGDVVSFDQINFRVRRGLDLINETEIVEFDQFSKSQQKAKPAKNWFAKKPANKKKDTAGLARARLQSTYDADLHEAEPFDKSFNKPQVLKSRYTAYKPIFVGASLAFVFFALGIIFFK